MLIRESINKQYYEIKQETLSLTLTERQCCDLELILNHGFYPLQTFLNQDDYLSVLENNRLSNGALWPMPIMLDIDKTFANKLDDYSIVALVNAEGLTLAFLEVTDCFQFDKEKESLAVFGTLDQTHPGVFYLFNRTKDYYISGHLTGLALPPHYDFAQYRHTPQALQQIYREKGWQKIVAFQTRNPMHRAHYELTMRAHERTGANILIHPVVGMTKSGDIDYYSRVRCYEHILPYYPDNVAMLSLLPLAMRMAGPKEALWHALIRKNHFCTHFIVGRDHAGPGKDQQGKLFYDPYAAQQLTLSHQEELGIEIVPFQEMAYSKKMVRYYAIDEFPADDTPATVSGTALRDALRANQEVPSWFSYPAVMAVLRKAYPPRSQQGFAVFLTGLPSAGKSTIANALAILIREQADKPITILDGDIIRTHLSHGLGFSREDREMNITRVGFVAAEIVRHQGIVIIAMVAPYAKARHIVRQDVEACGGFIEVFVSTPLRTCEARDRKGMYQKARAGIIAQFTGVSDPYEEPQKPEVTIDTSLFTPQEITLVVLNKIKEIGYLV